MKNTINVCNTNTFIGNDYYKGRLNNTQYSRDEEMKKGFKRKPKSAETLRREQSDKKYLSRKNICDVCFTTKSLDNNTCLCD